MKLASPFSQCEYHNQCHWEKKYILKSNQVKNLEDRLDSSSLEHTERIKSLEKTLKSMKQNEENSTRLQEKILKQRRKIKNLKQVLTDKEKEISLLQSTIDFSNGKISNLRKCRQQSFDTISVLEAEIQRTKTLCQTPTKPKSKKKRKPNPSMFEIKTQTFSFEINEVDETNKKELQQIIEAQSKLIQEEKIKNKNLSNKLDLALTENNSLENKIESLNMKVLDSELRVKRTKDKVAHDLTGKIEKLKIENSELRFRLNEYDEKDTGFTDFESNELSSIDSFPKSRNSEESILNFCKICWDYQSLKEKAEAMENQLKVANKENQNLKVDIEKRKKSSLELHKILLENQKMFESFQNKFNLAHLQQEISKLNTEKTQVLQEIKLKQQELAKVNEAFIYKKINEKQKLQENRTKDSPNMPSVLKSFNRIKAFPEDYKKRRNIGSWCCNIQVFPNT